PQTCKDERRTVPRSAIDRSKRLVLRFAHTQEKISRCHSRRHVPENSRDTVYSGPFLPSRLAAIHDPLVGLPDVPADKLFGMRKPRYDVALAIGNQFRPCRRQSAFLQVIGEPSQVESGKYNAGEAAVAVVELLCEMYRFLAGDRIDPVVSDGEPIMSHRPREKRLIC